MRPATVAWLVCAPALAASAQPETAAPAAAPLRLSLEEASARAQANSARLAQLRALTQAAQAAVRGARAARLPLVESSFAYARNSEVPELVLALPGQTPRTIFPNIPDTWRARASLSLPLHTGGRITGALAAAQAQAGAASRDLTAGESDLVLETAVAYWSLVAARESERVLGEALAAYEKHLADARNREAVGLAARNEVLSVEVERDRAELIRLQAHVTASMAQADLARLVGSPSGTTIEPIDAVDAPSPEPAEGSVLAAQALASRPELAALEARLEAAEAGVRVQRAAGRPQAGFSAGYDYARPNTRVLPLHDAWNDTWSVGVGVTWSVFDGGRVSSAVAQADAQAEALRRQLDDARQRIQLEVTQRLLQLESARAGLAVAERARLAARENARVAAERYREGVGGSTELLDAETGLLRAGLERTAAAAGVRVALAGLDRAVGR